MFKKKAKNKFISWRKVSYITSWVLKGILISLFIISTFTGQFPTNIAVLIAIFIAFSPVIISRSYKIHFPLILDVVITTDLILDAAGRVFQLYHTTDWWWWDIMTHFTGSATISLVAFYLIFSLFVFKKIKMSFAMMGFVVFSSTLMLGSLWEIAEFYFDAVTGFNTYVNGANSVRDMVFDVIGGALVAILGSYYTRYIVSLKYKFKRLF